METQLPLKGAHLQFSFHVFCGQTAGWMKTPLGTEVDVGRGHIVLYSYPAPLQKRHSSPLLSLAHVYDGHSRPSLLLLVEPLLKCSLLVKDRCMSPYGITGPPDQSSRNSGMCFHYPNPDVAKLRRAPTEYGKILLSKT